MYLLVRRDDTGNFVLEMSTAIHLYLRMLPDTLRSVIEDPDFTSRAVRRLFPRAYDDSEKEREYRELLGDELRSRKLESICVFEDVLEAGSIDSSDASFVIPAEQFDTCLSFLNDMRVFLGEDLGIEDEDWEREIDPNDPRSDKILTLHLLGWVEQGLLEATGMVDLHIRPEDLHRPPDSL